MAVAMRGESPCTPTGAAQYTSAQLARFADEHNLTRSVARTAVCWNKRWRPNHSGPHRNRVRRPLRVAHHPRGDYARCRRLDRASLQPTQAPLGPRHDQPGRIPQQIHSDGTSRLTLCPPTRSRPLRSPPRPGRARVACAQRIPRRIARQSTEATNSARLEYVHSTAERAE
jgi:hypothetical protein